MDNPFKCFICDIEIKKKCTKNIFDIKLEHSKKPITAILKKLIGNDDSTIRARNELNACVLCDDCIDKLNAYDAACMLVNQVEYELKTMISRTGRRYKSRKIPVKTDVVNRTHPPFSGPLSVEFDEFQFDIDPDDGNNADVLDTSEPEVVTESEEQEFDSDDSFIWPKPRALKRKREKSAENEKKKRRLFKCIECPADYRSINDIQVIIRSNLFAFKYVDSIKIFLLLFWQLHLVSHKNPEFRCGLCNMRLAKGRESDDHEDLHLNRPVLQCIFCNEMFESKYLLAQHVEVHVSVIIGEIIWTICITINYSLFYLQNGGVNALCYICGLIITAKTMNSRHIKAHLGILDHECSYCPRKFVDAKQLNLHLRTHVSLLLFGQRQHESIIFAIILRRENDHMLAWNQDAENASRDRPT